MSRASAKGRPPGASLRWLFARLALQNLLRRPTRTLMLVVAVALASGAVFASFTVARGIQASMDLSFARMGADLVVVPADTMVNITSALLTVQPTDYTLDARLLDDIGRIAGVAQVAGQTIYRIPIMSGMPEHKVNLIVFDPQRDFTVMPWLQDRLPRKMQTGDLLSGARRESNVGDQIEPCQTPSTIYGRLGLSGVGPFDESLFASRATAAKLAEARLGGAVCIPAFDPKKISAVLVRLAFGATPEQVRFAIGRFPGVKVITGATIVISTRQTMNALLAGVAGFTALMLVGSLIMVSLLFSAIVAERRREVGLLRAIGSRRIHVIRMLILEAAFTTSIGGVCGIALGSARLMLFQRSLGYFLESLHVEFVWPASGSIATSAIVCALLASMVGVVGALSPAWRASREDPYVLIQGEAD